jgi:hypothetical protein
VRGSRSRPRSGGRTTSDGGGRAQGGITRLPGFLSTRLPTFPPHLMVACSRISSQR